MKASIAVAFDSSPASSGRHPGKSATMALTVCDRRRDRRRRSTRRSRSVRRCARVRSPGDGGTRRRPGCAAPRPARGRPHCPAVERGVGTPCSPARARWPSTRRPCRRARPRSPAPCRRRSPTASPSPSSSHSAAPALSPAVRRSVSCGHLPTSSSTVSIARYFDREPMTTSWPMLASRAAKPLPAGPVPPRIPMRMATAWHAHPVS